MIVYLSWHQKKPDLGRENKQKTFSFGKKQRLSGAQPEISTSDTPIVRSSLAHWKTGFRFCDDSLNKIMEKVQRGELPKEAAPLGFMYYPV